MSGEQRYEIGSVQGGTYRTIRIAVAVEPVMVSIGGPWAWRVRVTTTIEHAHPLSGVRWEDHLTPAAAKILAALLAEAHQLADALPTPTGPAATYPDVKAPNTAAVRAEERDRILFELRNAVDEYAGTPLVPGLTKAADVVLSGGGDR